jgi:hypothetical protein
MKITLNLRDYRTNETIREATDAEIEASMHQAKLDGGAGVIMVSGKPCYVEM